MPTMATIYQLGCTLLLLNAVLPSPSRREGHVTWRKCYDPFPGRHITTLPDLDATFLDMRYCNITRIEQYLFLGLANLETIEAYSNGMTNIHAAAFKPILNLSFLCLSHNLFTEVPVLEKNSLPGLKRLELHDNIITGLYNPRTFDSCVKLEKLWLQRNFIEYIHPDVFTPLTELRELDLSHNKIIFLSELMFVKNINLESLDVDENRLTYLEDGFISNIESNNLKDFQFFGNPWNCACLLELIVEVERRRVENYKNYFPELRYDGRMSECVFSGPFPCQRQAPSGLLSPQS